MAIALEKFNLPLDKLKFKFSPEFFYEFENELKEIVFSSFSTT
jgi:hypothetical protein